MILQHIFENIQMYLETNSLHLIELFIITNFVLIGLYSLKMVFNIKMIFELTFRNYMFWNIGAIITFILLNYLNIIEVNHQSIILVSFTWNKLFINIKNKFDNVSDKNKPKPNKVMNKLKTYI